MRRSAVFFLLKLGLREVVSLWKQFLAIIAIGAIAVTLFVGLQANADSLEQRVNAVFNAGNLADTYVTVNPMKGPQGDLSNLKEMFSGEADIEGRFYAFTHLNTHNSYCAISSSYPTISKESKLIASDPNAKEDEFFLVDSHLASTKPREEGEEGDLRCRIGEKAMVEFDLSPYVSSGLISDDIIRQLGFESHLLPGVKLEDTPLKKAVLKLEIPVTGIMDHPENVLLSTYSISVFLLSSKSFAKAFDEVLGRCLDREGIDLFYTALSFSPLGWDRDTDGRFPISNQFLIKGRENFDLDKANDRIEEYFHKKQEAKQNLLMLQKAKDTSFASTMEMDVVQARQLTYVFPFVFFAVAILVILTTMSQLILKERTQIGTLKAMGLSKGKISRYYMAITGAVVGLGILIGEILGPIIIPLILDNKYSILYSIPKTSYVFPVLAGVLTAAAFLALSFLVTFLTVRKEAALLPAESMRPSAKGFKGRSSDSRKPIPSKSQFAIKMAARNIRNNLVKSLMVALGVMGCTALLVCGFGIDDTIDHGVSLDPVINNNADISLTLTAAVDYQKITEDLQGLFGVDSLREIQGYSRNNAEISFEEKSVNSFYNIYGEVSSVEKKEAYDFLPFSWEKGKAMLSKKIADRISCKEGDSITFSYGNKTVNVEVGRIIDIFYSNGVYVDASTLDDHPSSFSTYFVSFVSLPEDYKTTLSSLSYVGEAMSSEAYKESIKGILSSVSSMTNAVKVFAILLAVVVLYNISILNYRERTRDIATMKVLGFNKLEIANSLLFETMALTVVGVFFGLLAGWPFLYLVLYINQVEVVSYMYTVYPLSYFLSFVLTFIVSLLINAYLSSRTDKIKMVESLKSVE